MIKLHDDLARKADDLRFLNACCYTTIRNLITNYNSLIKKYNLQEKPIELRQFLEKSIQTCEQAVPPNCLEEFYKIISEGMEDES